MFIINKVANDSFCNSIKCMKNIKNQIIFPFTHTLDMCCLTLEMHDIIMLYADNVLKEELLIPK